MVIPPEKLTKDVLTNIVESFISREGTDYGETELSLKEKVELLLPQIYAGEVLVTFDETTESVNLVNASDYRAG